LWRWQLARLLNLPNTPSTSKQQNLEKGPHRLRPFFNGGMNVMQKSEILACQEKNLHASIDF
jgi:hypothetical protein